MVPTRCINRTLRLGMIFSRLASVPACGKCTQIDRKLWCTSNNVSYPFRSSRRSIVTSAKQLASFGGSNANDGAANKTDNCGGNKFAPACIAPELVATYDEIIDLPSHPEKLLIDVREPSELAATGQIPTSINIPLKTLRTELSQNAEVFEAKYGRKKPAADDPIIFSCRSGVRAGQAAFEADQLGFHNVKNYVGSWQEYGPKHGLPVK